MNNADPKNRPRNAYWDVKGHMVPVVGDKADFLTDVAAELRRLTKG